MAGDDKKVPSGTVVAGRQSNYGVYHLPAGLPSVPLYQAVALWGWRLGRAFSREELAEAFHISTCRAGDVMSYIRRARADKIVSRQHYVPVPGGVRMRYLQIMMEPQIEGGLLVKPAHPHPSHSTDNKEGGSLPALRRWFIGGAGGSQP